MTKIWLGSDQEYWATRHCASENQGPYLNGKTSYCQISWSLEAARLDVIMIISLWNLKGISAIILRSCGKTSAHWVNGGPVYMRGGHRYQTIQWCRINVKTFQITNMYTVCLTAYLGAKPNKTPKLCITDTCWGGVGVGHRWPVDSPHTKSQLCGKRFHVMTSSCTDGATNELLRSYICHIFELKSVFPNRI